jgi:DNA-binding protein YbaB
MSKQQYPPLVLELVDRKPSSFVLKGTENNPEPDRLDTSSDYVLLNDSTVLVAADKKGEPKKRKKTRWISGSDVILVEEQKKLGINPNPLTDLIVFKFGRLSVERSGNTVGLYDFLKSYDGNVSNPDRPENVMEIFREIDTAVEAEESISDINDLSKAISYLAALQTEKGGQGSGAKTFEYKSEKLVWLCKLFNLTTGESDPERLKGLMARAQTNPETFNATVEDASSDLKVIIKTAREMGVIMMDTELVSFADDKSVICKLKSKAMNDKIDELAEFLRSGDGELHNSAIRVKVEHAKSESVK